MADNYLERQYADYLQAKSRREEEKRRQWRKRLEAYKKKQQSTKDTLI